MSNATKNEFPMTVAHETIRTLTAKIYRATNAGAFEYTLTYYNQTGERKRQVSRDLAALEARATEILNDLAGGRPVEASGALTAHERDEYAQLKAILAEVSAAPLTAARHYVEAVKVMGADMVIEAARFYHKRHNVTPRTVGQAADELIKAKTTRNRDTSYVAHLKKYVNSFAAFCLGAQISVITHVEIQDFLNSLGLSPRTYNNYRKGLYCLFEFAKGRNYVAKDWNGFASIEREDDAGGEISIYTPETIRDMLTIASDGLIPFLALGAFAGLRSAEIARLDWSAVNFEAGTITIKGKFTAEDGTVKRVAKTGTRRIVPMLPALRAWLEPRKGEGKIIKLAANDLYIKLRKEINGKWKGENALRHSFVSYRVAETQNVNATALECGNSPQIIFRHYRELVTQAQAKAWFNVLPATQAATPANVIQSGIAAAA